MDKSQNEPTGSSNINMNKHEKNLQNKQTLKKSSAKKEEIKESELLSVADNANAIVNDMNAEEETCDSNVPANFDTHDKNSQARVMTHPQEKISFKGDNDSIQTPSCSSDQVDLDANIAGDIAGPSVFNRVTAKYPRVREITGDVFKMPKHYSLAHCVAEDFMNGGIAAKFSLQFNNYYGDLSNQRQKAGGLAILSFPHRFIYYLVTKKYSNRQSMFSDLWNSLQAMRKHVRENNVRELAMPRIGCAADLKWSEVKFLIEMVFHHTDVYITVCNLVQEEDVVEARKVVRKCKIVHVFDSVLEMEANAMIVYFGTEDGVVDNIIEKLDRKFGILPDYKRGPRALGQVVQTDTFNGNYVIVFGFIVKKSIEDAIDYTCVQKCAKVVNSVNHEFRQRAYQFLALHVIEDPPDDEMQFHHVLNILSSTLNNLDVYVCYPKDLLYLMPKIRELAI